MEGKEREGDNDPTHPCRKFLAPPLLNLTTQLYIRVSFFVDSNNVTETGQPSFLSYPNNTDVVFNNLKFAIYVCSQLLRAVRVHCVQAEKIASQMITEARLNGCIDQIDSIVHFEGSQFSTSYSATITSSRSVTCYY